MPYFMVYGRIGGRPTRHAMQSYRNYNMVLLVHASGVGSARSIAESVARTEEYQRDAEWYGGPNARVVVDKVQRIPESEETSEEWDISLDELGEAKEKGWIDYGSGT